jgi:membrane protease YdiL (CAAX protease family)
MVGIVAVLLFPVVLVLGFGVAYGVWNRVGGNRDLARFERLSYAIFFALLLVPAAAIVADPDTREYALDAASAPLEGLPLGVWLAIAVVTGGALAALDEALGRLIRAHVKPTRPATRRLLEGRTGPMSAALPRGPGLVVLVLAIAVAEEWLWRGFLLRAIPAETAAGTGVALVVSAIAFGLNHYYFGARNVATKALHGLAWGGLVLASGSMWIAVVSHLCFDLVVGWSIVRGPHEPSVRAPGIGATR